MQIFLTSHTRFSSRTSSHKKEQGRTRGFTLIELLICCAIIGIITAIVLLKYSSFDSTTLLKGAAYEIALNLREAQVKSVSVLRTDTNTFDNPYGISFAPDTKTYKTFRYDDEVVAPPARENPNFANNTYAHLISDVTLDRGMFIKDVCVDTGSGYDCEIDRLDISFRRPEFKALFYAPQYSADPGGISKGKILIGSTNNADAGFIIEVTRLGQISINPIP